MATLQYRVDERGMILLRDGRSPDPEAPPLAAARVRNGQGGFMTRPLAAMGFVWTPTPYVSEGGWVLRTHGEPTTMAHVRRRWAKLVTTTTTTSNLDVDERLVLALIASETGDATPDADGQVRAPRTEVGYPGRTGENDPGDFERDAQDWRASSGTHSSHGLMQTLIGTAVRVRPKLFAGVDPSRHRTVLWDPANSIACGAGVVDGFPHRVRHDPVAARVMYASGSIRPAANAWGARVYDDYVMLSFLALWNDLAFLIAQGEAPTPPQPADKQAAWVTLGLACFALSLVSGLYALRYARRPAYAARLS